MALFSKNSKEEPSDSLISCPSELNVAKHGSDVYVVPIKLLP